ncbi:glycosyltransferase [Maribacter sp. CXY002]|uniref:glycosyltransferase n=1 Tax=Maribacter luteocoastalis TaxID=3407671 RepID=UPI003B67D5B8
MITIIIPAHKEKQNLTLLLSSLKTYEGYDTAEIFVALSPQSENKYIEFENRNIHFITCAKKGRAAQMNEAAKLANGNILVFLHADVKPPCSFLTDIRSTISQNYDAGFFSYKFDKESPLLKINASFTSKDGIFTGGGDQCLFIKKDIFNVLKGFNEEQLVMEDFEFFRRMKENKVSYTIVKKDLVVSARKYESNSYLRVNLSNLLLVILFKMGYSSRKLKSLHDKLIRTPYNG